jgi:hypothetical protein
MGTSGAAKNHRERQICERLDARHKPWPQKRLTHHESGGHTRVSSPLTITDLNEAHRRFDIITLSMGGRLYQRWTPWRERRKGVSGYS